MASAAPAQEAMLAVRNPRTGQADFDLAVSSGPKWPTRPRGCAPTSRPGKRWASRGACGVMARWLGEVKAARWTSARPTRSIPAAATPRYLQGFITMGNIGGWLEDAPKALREPQVAGHEHLDADGRDRKPGRRLSARRRDQPVERAADAGAARRGAGAVRGLRGAAQAERSHAALRSSRCSRRCARCPSWRRCSTTSPAPAKSARRSIAEADTVCFTGSVPTGRKVAVACAERLIPCNLELGGKDPCIVTATADLERAATAVLRGAVYATGQVCYSVERVYVHESVHDALRRAAGGEGEGGAAQRRRIRAPGTSARSPSPRRPRS